VRGWLRIGIALNLHPDGGADDSGDASQCDDQAYQSSRQAEITDQEQHHDDHLHLTGQSADSGGDRGRPQRGVLERCRKLPQMPLSIDSLAGSAAGDRPVTVIRAFEMADSRNEAAGKLDA
jgi:hypothetical protein